MKLRNGFVSNSSSSSFIVSGTKDATSVSMTITVELPATKYETEKDLAEYFREQYDFDPYNANEENDGEWVIEKWEECLAEILKGKAIFIGNCSNEDDDGISQFLYREGIDDDMLDDGKLISFD